MGNSPFTVTIPYDTLLLLVMGLFMFIGATRGAYREAITTFGLVVLLALLIEPALARPIIGYLSRLVQLVIAFIRSGFSVNPEELLGTYRQVEVPFTADNPYALLIFALVGVVLLSYSSRGGKEATALSRIVGGLLGLFNGFVVVNLFKEYVVEYVRRRPGAVAITGPAEQVSVAVSGLPVSGPLAGDSWQIVVALLGAVAVLLFLTSAIGMPLKEKKDKKGSP